ncbi:hypothetical protein [Streptomyces sp. NPDC005181]|uniref:hypothetical protein n=1 Tax=Streptomyces sp. NPDC005181 TaxID=3156869 RepID=UPI0033A57A1E
MTTRTVAVTAAVVGAAVLATTGITYASAAGSTQAAPSIQQAAPFGGDSDTDKGKGNEGKGDEGRDRDYGGGGGGGGGGGYYHDEGRIHFNERTYSAHSEEGCITVVSGLGSRSFNVRNDSHKTVEIFRGATCDNGSPVATVGPWSTSNGVFTRSVHGGVKVRNGVVGSFRVVKDHYYKW